MADSAHLVSRLGRFVTVSTCSTCLALAIAPHRLAAAQPPAHEGAATPTPDAAPSPVSSSAFPATVAPPSAVAPTEALHFTVDAYGLIIAESAYVLGNSSNNPDLPEWSIAGDDALFFTARQTRFGVRASWNDPPSKLGVKKVSGLIESDFSGAFVGQGSGYFTPLPRLRLATATAEWSTIRFSFGQDWSVLAPLNPDSAFHSAVPGFTASGNLWARIPQLRGDGAIEFEGTSDGWRLIWVAALVASVQSDAISTDQSGIATARIAEGGESSLVPAGEARIAAARSLFGKSLEIGISGHLGDRKIAFTGGDERQGNGAVAVDLTLPLPCRFAFKGEAFWGTGLDAFFGGIDQGIAHTTDANGDITSLGDSIATYGLWGQASWAAFDWLTLYAGAGFDNPNNDDLLAINATTNRTLNTAAYGEVAVELARGMVLWVEYDFLRTNFEAAATEHTHTVSLVGALTL